MTFYKIDGTTSSRFKIGKNGVMLLDDSGKLKIIQHDTVGRIVGINDIRATGSSSNIPDKEAVESAIFKKIRTVSEAPNDLIVNDYFLLLNAETGYYTLKQLTSNGIISIQLEISDNYVVKLIGDQTISGNKTFNSSIAINSSTDENGVPLQNSEPGLIIKRGGSAPVSIFWKEQDLSWKVKDTSQTYLEKKVSVEWDTLDGGTW